MLADDAQLAMREPSLGLVPDLAGTKPLVELVGFSRALEICASGRWVRAEEAERIGLASLVVPKAELDVAPSGAVRATKELLLGGGGRTHGEQQAAERRAQAQRLRDLARGRAGPS